MTLTLDDKSNYDVANMEDFEPSEFMVQTVKRFLMKTPVFENQTCDEEISRTITKILTWKPPEYMLNKFPYYLCGNNYDNGPVWMVEGGTFDLVDLYNQPAVVYQEIDKFEAQVALRVLKSVEQKNGDINRAHVIVDMDGINFAKVGSREAMALIWNIATHYGEFIDYVLQQGFLLNVNFVIERVLKMLRTILRQVLERMEVFRCDRPQWFARLQSVFPSAVLPEYYGDN